MSASARPENQQRPSSSDEDVVFVAHVATVRGTVQASGVVGTRAVVRARGVVPLRSVVRGRQGRPVRGTWRPVRGGARGQGGCGRRPLVGRPLGGRAVAHSGRGGKRARSASSSDEDVVCLGPVVAEGGKFIPRCVL